MSSIKPRCRKHNPAKRKRGEHSWEQMEEGVLTLEVRGEDSQRQKLWLDDLIAAIKHVFQAFPDATSELKLQTAQFTAPVALERAWAQQVKFNGKEILKWSELRVDLKRLCWKACKQSASSRSNNEHNKCDTAEALLGIVKGVAGGDSRQGP